MMFCLTSQRTINRARASWPGNLRHDDRLLLTHIGTRSALKARSLMGWQCGSRLYSCPDKAFTMPAMIKDPFQRLNLDREVLSVSQLNNRARLLLEDVFGGIWVEGEISNLAK